VIVSARIAHIFATIDRQKFSDALHAFFRGYSIKQYRSRHGPVHLAVTHLEDAMIKKFIRDESGATAIEYGLIAAGISVAIITVVTSLGSKLNDTFSAVQNALH
jgi:pilus assembly protein Flp/PilA